MDLKSVDYGSLLLGLGTVAASLLVWRPETAGEISGSLPAADPLLGGLLGLYGAVNCFSSAYKETTNFLPYLVDVSAAAGIALAAAALFEPVPRRPLLTATAISLFFLALPTLILVTRTSDPTGGRN